MKKSPPKPTLTKERDTALSLVRILKLFQLIALLKAGRWSIKQLVDRLDSSKSAFYRFTLNCWKKQASV